LGLYSVGRLLLTDVGEFARRLTHPRFGVKKTYRVKLSACPTDRDLAVLRQGIRLEDGIAASARARVVEKLRKNAWVEIEIHEGKNREVRRMFGALGYFVEKLIRIRVVAVSLAPLPRVELRPLLQGEIKALIEAVALYNSYFIAFIRIFHSTNASLTRICDLFDSCH